MPIKNSNPLMQFLGLKEFGASPSELFSEVIGTVSVDDFLELDDAEQQSATRVTSTTVDHAHFTCPASCLWRVKHVGIRILSGAQAGFNVFPVIMNPNGAILPLLSYFESFQPGPPIRIGTSSWSGNIIVPPNFSIGASQNYGIANMTYQITMQYQEYAK